MCIRRKALPSDELNSSDNGDGHSQHLQAFGFCHRLCSQVHSQYDNDREETGKNKFFTECANTE